MNRFEYARARSIEEALDLVADRPGSMLKAGGIDLLDHMKEHLIEPTRLVDLHQLPGAQSIDADAGNGFRIGPLVTLAATAGHPELQKSHAALTQACGQAASPQIRNVATIGGNLLQRPRCWYYRLASYRCLKKGGDTCFSVVGENRYHTVFPNGACHAPHPSNAAMGLLALDGNVMLQGSRGRRTLSAERFFTIPDGDPQRENARDPDELLTAITLPAATNVRSAYASVRERAAFDWPLVSTAVALKIDGGVVREARIYLGAIATVPHRATGVEQQLVGNPLNEQVVEAAVEGVASGAQPLSENEYKLALLPVLLRRTLQSLI